MRTIALFEACCACDAYDSRSRNRRVSGPVRLWTRRSPVAVTSQPCAQEVIAAQTHMRNGFVLDGGGGDDPE